MSLATVWFVFSAMPLLAQGTWTTVAPLPTARSQMGVTEGPDSRIYAIGGLTTVPTPYVPVNIAQAYGPASNSWATITPMPTARYNLAAVSVGGLVYAIGGYNGTPLSTVEAYNPATNTWTTIAPMPTARQNLSAAVGLDGRIYAIGGSTDGGGTSVATAEVYDPVAKVWSTLAPMPTSREGLTASAGNDGRIYVIGGLSQPSGIVRNTVEAYSPLLGSWTTLATMPTPRTNLSSAVAADGTVYAFGGQSLNGPTLSTVEAYTPSSNHWATVTAMPTARAPGGAALGSDGRIYVIGGFSVPAGEGYVLQSVVEAYAPTLNTITTLLATPNPSTTGQEVTLTATVSPNSATGMVVFMDGQSTLGSAALSLGAATLTVSSLSVASHSLTAVYTGDARDFASTSSAVTQTVATTICSYSLGSSSASVIGGASNSTFTVTAPAGCTWTATVPSGSASAVSITNGSPGTGNGTVAYSLTANQTASVRPLSIVVAGQNNFSQTFTINQAAAATVCTYALTQSSQSFPAGGGTGSFGIVTQAGCPWSLSTANAPWTTITSPPSGSGNGTVNYSLPNYTSTVTRNGTLLMIGTSAGQPYILPFALTQLGLVVMLSCTASLPPTGPAQVALEGRTQLLGTLTLTCTGVTTTITADITLTLNTPVTNQVTMGLSDATLTNGAATQGAQVIGYSMLRWPAVRLTPNAGSATVTITNVRTDASTLAPPAGPTSQASFPITGTLSVTAAGAVPVTNPNLTLANAVTTLVFQAGTAAPPSGTQEILQLSYQESSAAPTAFSSVAPATRLRAVLSNIPVGVQVYAPVASTGGSAKASLYTADCSGAGGSLAAGISLAGGTYSQLAVSGGVATATWVVQTTTFGIDTLTFPLLLINPNGINLNIIQATGSLAPVSPAGNACGGADPSAAAIPRYHDFSMPPTSVFLRLTTVETATRGASQSKVAEVNGKKRLSPLDAGSNVTLTFQDNVMNEGTTVVMNAMVNGSVQTGINTINCAANGGVGGTCTGYNPANPMNTMQPGQYACTWTSVPPGTVSCTGSGTEDPNANSQPTVPTSAGVTAAGSPGDITATQASGLVTQDFGPDVQIENPAPGSVFGRVTVSGWAVDANFSVGNVQIQLDGVTQTTITSFSPRQDICNAYSNYFGCMNAAGPNIGFSYTFNADTLTGSHVITVLAANTNTPPVSTTSAPLMVTVQVAMQGTRVGIFRGGAAFLEDSNGDGAYDAGVDRFIPNFTGPGGFVVGDYAVTGDWTGDGSAKVGVYRSTTGQWFLDANNNGILDAGDFTYNFGGVAGDLPVVGDWIGLGKSCVGIFRSGFFWVLDLNCNGSFDGTGPGQDTSFPFGGVSGDLPVVGAWSGGATKVGVVRKYAPGGVPIGNPFYWVVDAGAANAGVSPANHQPDLARVFAFGGLSGDVFVTGDWYNTGISVAGVYRNGLWVLDAAQPGDPQTSHNQSPLTLNYGGVAGDVPVTGKW